MLKKIRIQNNPKYMLAPHILIEKKFVLKRKKKYVFSKPKSLVKFKS